MTARRTRRKQGRKGKRGKGGDTTRLTSRALLAGQEDEGSVLRPLKGIPHAMKQIWNDVTTYWDNTITIPEDGKRKDGETPIYALPVLSPMSDLLPSYHQTTWLGNWNTFKCSGQPGSVPKRTTLKGPESLGLFPPPNPAHLLDYNMMPFKVGKTFEECLLPPDVKPYWDLINYCLDPECMGKIFFLTIQENWVNKGETQRRPGLHVDSPGNMEWKELYQANQDKTKVKKRQGAGTGSCPDEDENGRLPVKWVLCYWGEGECWNPKLTGTTLNGGIFLASNMADSCRVWDCSVKQSEVGKLGDIEHLREGIYRKTPERRLLPGCVYWITDRTPHESLPASRDGYRQFFRVVTDKVSLWYIEHSTPNPMGVKPDPKVTLTVKGNKFNGERLEIIEGGDEGEESEGGDEEEESEGEEE